LGVNAFVLQYRLGPRYHHPAPLQDAQRAIRIVRARAAEWRIDPARVGILGFSAGGHLASTTITHFDNGDRSATNAIDRQSSRPDFAILAYPVISMIDPVAHAYSREMLLGASPDLALVRSLSNELQVTSRTPPTFLFHTADDPVVPLANATKFYEALQRAGVASELRVFPHGPHGVGLAQQDSALATWPGMAAAWLGKIGVLAK
jgi:acetyl esterase/lipase